MFICVRQIINKDLPATDDNHALFDVFDSEDYTIERINVAQMNELLDKIDCRQCLFNYNIGRPEATFASRIYRNDISIGHYQIGNWYIITDTISFQSCYIYAFYDNKPVDVGLNTDATIPHLSDRVSAVTIADDKLYIDCVDYVLQTDKNGNQKKFFTDDSWYWYDYIKQINDKDCVSALTGETFSVARNNGDGAIYNAEGKQLKVKVEDIDSMKSYIMTHYIQLQGVLTKLYNKIKTEDVIILKDIINNMHLFEIDEVNSIPYYIKNYKYIFSSEIFSCYLTLKYTKDLQALAKEFDFVHLFIILVQDVNHYEYRYKFTALAEMLDREVSALGEYIVAKYDDLMEAK